MNDPDEVVKGLEIIKELKKGPWPSYITETEKTRYPLKLYAASLYLKRDLWTTGGYVSVPGVPTGILMRVTSRPDIGESANVVRVYLPSGNFVTSKMLRNLADFADKYGVSMVHAITTSEDFEIPGIPKEKIRDFVAEFRATGMEVGSTGDAFRNTTTCVGPALCEYATFDTPKFRDDFYNRFNDYAKYPTFPHKLKLKISGCPLDCARASQKGDIAIIGSWEGAPLIIREKLKLLSEKEMLEIVNGCPTGAISLKNGELNIEGDLCTQCMKCVKLSKGSILPGEKKKYLLYVGGKLRGKKGPFTAKLVEKMDDPYQAFDIIERIINVYIENAARKERLGDMIFRIGMKNFLDLIEKEEKPYHIKDLRTNIFYKVSEEEKTKMLEELKKSLGGE
ncbi:MAG: hypothetical protein RXP30_04365 [Thermoplasmata archaeon]|nr:hypothetical protein [Euryarchaeota archaeon]MVT36094.1 hypothetical protein [Euryarchaeota archaeon]